MQVAATNSTNMFSKIAVHTVMLGRASVQYSESSMLSVSANVRYTRVKWYSRKYALQHIANKRSTHRNTQCDYTKFLY
jgi:hypothetical protein